MEEDKKARIIILAVTEEYILGSKNGEWKPYKSPLLNKYREIAIKSAHFNGGFLQLGRDQFKADRFMTGLKKTLKLN